MYSVGLDVHSNRSSLCVLDPNGNLHTRREVRGPWPKLLEAIEALPGPMAICFEASCGYGYLHDELAKRAASVRVAHPGHLRLIFRSKQKHDRIDAQKLAKLVHLDEVPQVHVPGIDVRSWRKTIEMRQSLVKRRTACKNRIHATLRGLGQRPQGQRRSDGAKRTGLWTKKGRAWLASLVLPEGEKLAINLELAELDLLQQQIRLVEKHLDRIARQHPGVGLLRTIPGVGPRTAEAFVAYVDDVHRFSRTRKIGSYFGLVPCQDSSGGVHRLGHITRDGPGTVRQLLCEAAHVAIRKSPAVRSRFERLMRGDPDRKKIALVAIAHYLARVMGAMLRSGEAWHGDA